MSSGQGRHITQLGGSGKSKAIQIPTVEQKALSLSMSSTDPHVHSSTSNPPEKAAAPRPAQAAAADRRQDAARPASKGFTAKHLKNARSSAPAAWRPYKIYILTPLISPRRAASFLLHLARLLILEVADTCTDPELSRI